VCVCVCTYSLILRDTRYSSIYTSNNDDGDNNYNNARRRYYYYGAHKDTVIDLSSSHPSSPSGPPQRLAFVHVLYRRASGRVDNSTANEAGSAGPVTAPLNPDIRPRQNCLLSSDSVLFISPTITRITRLCDSNIN